MKQRKEILNTMVESKDALIERLVRERDVARAKILPPLDEELINILGKPNFTCPQIATILRRMGQQIEYRAEAEQAAVIYWFLQLYLTHGQDWHEEAKRILVAIP